MVVLFLLLVLTPKYLSSVLGGSDGGACNCAQPALACPPIPICPPPLPQLCPPPAPPCPPQPLCLPCPPPLPLCPPPSLPPLQLPCPPQPSCNCACKRKKRSTSITKIATEYGTSGYALCNDNYIRKIILKNLSSDMKVSKAAIYSELKSEKKADYVVLCSHSSLSFTSDSTNYCVGGNTDHLCYVFQL
ncbi:Transcription elongation regulator [Dirofilaria immitis]